MGQAYFGKNSKIFPFFNYEISPQVNYEYKLGLAKLELGLYFVFPIFTSFLGGRWVGGCWRKIKTKLSPQLGIAKLELAGLSLAIHRFCVISHALKFNADVTCLLV